MMIAIRLSLLVFYKIGSHRLSLSAVIRIQGEYLFETQYPDFLCAETMIFLRNTGLFETLC